MRIKIAHVCLLNLLQEQISDSENKNGIKFRNIIECRHIYFQNIAIYGFGIDD